MVTKTNVTCRCPDCGEKFKVPHGESLPNFCPLCGSYVGIDPNFVPTRMNIGTVTGLSGDWAYRKAEADSEARAEVARPQIEAQLVAQGVPVEEAQRQAAVRANEIKVTNLRDNIRDGEVAAIAPNNVVSQVANSIPGFSYFQGGSGASPGGKADFNESGFRALSVIQGARSTTPSVPSAAGMQGGFGKVG